MARKGTGRVTPRKGVVPAPAKPEKSREWSLQESRAVRNGWVWRGHLMMALLFVGVAIIMQGNHHGTLAVLWLVIAAGWFAASMWLWRQHGRYMRGR
jgi:hypothetical protein